MTKQLVRLLDESPIIYWKGFFGMNRDFAQENEPGNIASGSLRKGVAIERKRQIISGQRGAILAVEKNDNPAGIYFHGYALFTPRLREGIVRAPFLEELFSRYASEDTQGLLVRGLAHELKNQYSVGSSKYVYTDIPKGADNFAFYKGLGFDVWKDSQDYLTLRVPLRTILGSFEVRKR